MLSWPDRWLQHGHHHHHQHWRVPAVGLSGLMLDAGRWTLDAGRSEGGRGHATQRTVMNRGVVVKAVR